MFWGKGAACSNSCCPKKPPFFDLTSHHSYMKTWITVETTYKPPQGPHVFSKVPFVNFGSALVLLLPLRSRCSPSSSN